LSSERQGILIEAHRRGLLTGREKELFDEAVSRGLIDLAPEEIAQQKGRMKLSEELVPGIPQSRVSTVGAPRDTGPFRAGSRAALEQFAGNVSNVPNALVNMAGEAATGRQRRVSRRRIPTQEDVDAGGFDLSNDFPRFGDRRIPTPTGREIVSGVETAAEVPGQVLEGEDIDLNAMFRRNMADAEALAAEHPTATTVGGAVGDAATILTGRAPVVRGRAPQLAARRQAIETEAKRRLDLIPESVREELSDVVTSRVAPFLAETARLTKRGAGKAVGTGLEGATLALLNEGDPESMFWFGAGGQAAGSASLFLVEKPIKRLLPFVGTAWLASEMFKAAAPGEQGFFESKDFAVQKANAALALGLTAALAGAGRLRGSYAERYPVFFDAITATPRGALLSRLQELTKAERAGNDLPLRVMSRFARNPTFFNENQQRSLGRALNSERENAFNREVERLMRESSDFRKKVDEL